MKCVYKFFFAGAFEIVLCSFNTAFSNKSKQSTPFSSKKSAQDLLNDSSQVCPVFPSLYWSTSSYMSSNLFEKNKDSLDRKNFPKYNCGIVFNI